MQAFFRRMTYDVFISYSRSDVLWAEKLERNLVSRGLTVYRDQTRLAAGDEWEPALRNAIIDSQAFIVLWSAEASRSKWVIKEQESFRQMMHVDAREGKAAVRRMVQICLEGANPEYPAFQTLLDLERANAYAGGVANVNPNLWASLVDKVERGVAMDASLPTIHEVILASTRERMESVLDDHKPKDAATYAELIATLKLVSKRQFAQRYGAERSEWRPFGGEKSILALMSELREELLARGVPPFLWKPISEEQWKGTDNRRKLRDRLMEEPCVIILDAVSLYDSQVWDRYDDLLPCLDNPKAAIAVLAPYSNSERHYLQTVLETAASKMFEPFYLPDKAQVPIAAQCSVLADDRYEMSRLVAAMIRTAFKKEKNESLRFGSRPRR
jgi:TIR domain